MRGREPALRWLRTAAQVVVLTVLAVLAVAGQNRLSGDVVLSLTPTHGLHRSDLVVAALWLVGVVLSLPGRARAPRVPHGK